MNSTEELRDYVIADTIQQINSMTREELVRTLVLIATTPLEQMDANELMIFRKEYYGKWEGLKYDKESRRETT